MASFEDRVQQVGQSLLRASGSYVSEHPHRLASFFLSQVGRHPGLMRELLRLTDVFSSLKREGTRLDDWAVADHVRQYLGEYYKGLAPVFRLATLPVLRTITSRLTEKNIVRMARQFIAGQSFEEVVPLLDRFESSVPVLAVTFDLLGEAVLSDSEAEAYCRRYLELIEKLGDHYPAHPRSNGGIPKGHVSIKLSSLTSHFNPFDPVGTKKAVLPSLVEIFRKAHEKGVFVNIDVEQSATVELAYEIFKEAVMDPALRESADFGIVLQAYLKRSEQIFDDLLEWVKKPVAQGGRGGVPVQVRLVKGAYWDYERAIAGQHHWPVPVFSEKGETDRNFEKITEKMLSENRWEFLRPAFGSHNARSLAHAMALAEKNGVPSTELEFQMLYGMEEDLRYAVAARGFNLRVYTPVGDLISGIAYLVRRILENASQKGFVQLRRAKKNPDLLLAAPFLKSPSAPLCQRGEKGGIFVNEPLTDFSRTSEQEKMKEALAAVRKQFGKIHPMRIGGEAVTEGEVHAKFNPYRSGQELGKIPFANREQLEKTLTLAESAAEEWRKTPAKKRAASLLKAAEKMREHRFELAAWIIYDVAKTWAEADADVVEAIDFCEYYAREAIRIEEETGFYEGRGITVVLPPWNFPIAIATGMTVAALAAGNPVILKPSGRSPLVGAKLAEILSDPDVGFPPGVFNMLFLNRTLGTELMESKKVAMIAFTGSKEVGLDLLKRSDKKVIAEMGGKNAIIIDQDAPPDDAVKYVLQSAFGYQGQKCSAASRVIVHKAVYPRFLERLRQAIESLPVGPPEDPGTFLTSVIDKRAAEGIGSLLKQQGGTQIICRREGGGDSFVPPTLVTDVDWKHPLAQEELFGPVVTILPYKKFGEALRMANGTSYALTAGLISRNLDHIERFKKEMQAGNLYINRGITGAVVQRQPFGGFKLSGTGPKAGGVDYLYSFMRIKNVGANRCVRPHKEDMSLLSYITQEVPAEINQLVREPLGFGLGIVTVEANPSDVEATLSIVSQTGNRHELLSEKERNWKEILKAAGSNRYDFIFFIGTPAKGGEVCREMAKNIKGGIPPFIGIPFETVPEAPDFDGRLTQSKVLSENLLQEGVDLRLEAF
ncbi:MAG: bifunctional proline dehydrogenase/L-glutamate gamma-semialdehyde dehydrogenase, partial [bacterium]|nr:bifunctional proline dehydrogenase/L-glutamate gamma-semialdehyde dehydrogenase [bacterium]